MSSLIPRTAVDAFGRYGGQEAGRHASRAAACSSSPAGCVLAAHHLRRAWNAGLEWITDCWGWGGDAEFALRTINAELASSLDRLKGASGIDMWRRVMDKPRGVVPHQVVAKARRRHHERRLPYRTKQHWRRQESALRMVRAEQAIRVPLHIQEQHENEERRAAGDRTYL